MLGVIDPGDEVIVFEPFYENYGPDAILAGAVPRYVTLREPDWSFDEAEPELRRDWESAKDRSKLAWDKAKHATRDAWQRLSDNVERRLVELQCSSPYPLRIVATIDGTVTLERELHERFVADRMTGEWFRPSRAIQEYLGTRLAQEPLHGETGVILPPYDVRPLPDGREYRRIVSLFARGGWWTAPDVGRLLGSHARVSDTARTKWASVKCVRLYSLGWVAKRRRWHPGNDERFPGYVRNEYALRRLIEEGVVK
jgi:hypothetical protein